MGSVTALPPNSHRFQKKYILAGVLPASGIYTSTEAIKLIQATGLSYHAAKGNVNRAKADDGVWCTNRLRLEGNGRLFANTAFLNSPDFPQAVIDKLTLLRPGLARTLIALLHKEVLLVSHVARLLASPVPSSSQHSSPTLERELNGLLDLPFVKREGDNGPLDRVSLKKLKDPRKERALAQWAMTRHYLEEKLTYVVLDHFARMNLVAWRPADRQVDRDFNGYPFSGVTFSHLRPLLRKVLKDARLRPMPTVFDIHCQKIGREVVESFAERIARAGFNTTSKLPILGVIAAQDFYPQAWIAAKDAGLVAINLTNFFGKEAFELLETAQKILSQIPVEGKEITDADISRMATMVHELKTHPWITEFRGIAFETATGFIVSADNWQDVTMDVHVPAIVKGAPTTRQVDVTATRHSGTELIVVECKGELSGKKLDGDYVRKFFTETLPAYIKSYESRFPIESVHAEIWTTGIVDEEALQALRELKLKRNVVPALLGMEEIKARVHPAQARVKELLAVIALDGMAADFAL